MKDFFKENKTIIFGLGMPLIFITLFCLYTLISSNLTEDPKYNVLYSMSNHSDQDVKVSVINNTVKIKVFKGKNINSSNSTINNEALKGFSLWFFNSKTRGTKEIYLSLGDEIKNEQESENNSYSVYNVDIPELKNIKFNKSSISDDGYKINKKRDGAKTLIGGLFQNYSSDGSISLFKNYKNIEIKETSYYNYNNFKFIGWTESDL